MSNNVFQSCESESEIMKRLFELSGAEKYSRVELLQMANKRREEIKNIDKSTIVLNKVILPKEEHNYVNELAKQSVSFSSAPMTSTEFEFITPNTFKF